MSVAGLRIVSVAFPWSLQAAALFAGLPKNSGTAALYERDLWGVEGAEMPLFSFRMSVVLSENRIDSNQTVVCTMWIRLLVTLSPMNFADPRGFKKKGFHFLTKSGKMKQGEVLVHDNVQV